MRLAADGTGSGGNARRRHGALPCPLTCCAACCVGCPMTAARCSHSVQQPGCKNERLGTAGGAAAGRRPPAAAVQDTGRATWSWHPHQQLGVVWQPSGPRKTCPSPCRGQRHCPVTAAACSRGRASPPTNALQLTASVAERRSGSRRSDRRARPQALQPRRQPDAACSAWQRSVPPTVTPVGLCGICC